MKRINMGVKGGFIAGVLSCLFVLAITFFTKTIYAESEKDSQTKMSENSGVTTGVIPLSYGEVKAVTGDASNGVYFLWFEDATGTIRVVGVTRGVVSERVTAIMRN